MKNYKIGLIICVLALFQMTGNAQEKKIKFNKGVLKICSSKNFKISGYDGNEVIIKSLHENRGNNSWAQTITATGYSNSSSFGLKKMNKDSSSKKGQVFYLYPEGNRKQGLKKLGKKYENEELGIYFVIEQKNGELIFKDKKRKGLAFTMYSGESYEVKVPNSVMINWTTGDCSDIKTNSRNLVTSKSKTVFFYDSNPSSITDFRGEVEISSTLSNMKLVDVTGPVTINTIGGNVTVEFDKKKPQKLYSIYSNNGFIDVQIPKGSSISADVTGKSVYSDVDFKVLEEKEDDDFGHIKTKMKLKLGSGKVKMKLDAGFGNIYLRQK